ncbi:SDR family NAD(P)-dependent oxidoreductase [uncultured Tateyamaria sp.]|uniref:SDR family NAD(P)-dependent oxidoreductase n=1 Tax=Tateyamaria sp. 1078 TaxID=3417464 RepID=UPI00261D9320|nr:SDR family NAD(P)-dependent oxidoreductase [uncultured Tateyamaria sp.]
MHIVITGATRGIGAGLADYYRNAGHVVTGTGRSAGAQMTLDVTQPADHTAMAKALEGRAVDLLVCNAGVYLDKGEALDTGYAPDLWSQTFAANVTGVFLTVQSLLPNLALSAAPKVAIISSQMGSSTRASGTSLIYRVSKAAALNLGLNLASALRPEGIAVGVYHPGWVRTDMGGAEADISVDQAVTGLVERFAALGPDSTGCFETWDGCAHPL